MRIYHSPFQNAVSNAALEEYLFRRRPVQSSLLFYLNRDSVLWGRNQNPLRECALQRCLDENVTLVRRISGGGTVYHDPGNLNYSFVLPRAAYDPGRCAGLLLGALQDLGVPGARACSRHSLWVDSRKVSGSAYALSGPAVLLHGCLLVHSDLRRLSELLTPQITEEQEDSAARRIASVRSPVANLQDYVPGLQIPGLIEAICLRFVKSRFADLASPVPEQLQVEATLLEPYLKKFAGTSWTLELARP